MGETYTNVNVTTYYYYISICRYNLIAHINGFGGWGGASYASSVHGFIREQLLQASKVNLSVFISSIIIFSRYAEDLKGHKQRKVSYKLRHETHRLIRNLHFARLDAK